MSDVIQTLWVKSDLNRIDQLWLPVTLSFHYTVQPCDYS